MRVPLRIPPGLNADDTTYSAAGRWADCNCVRFDRDLPQTIGGWESLSFAPRMRRQVLTQKGGPGTPVTQGLSA